MNRKLLVVLLALPLVLFGVDQAFGSAFEDTPQEEPSIQEVPTAAVDFSIEDEKMFKTVALPAESFEVVLPAGEEGGLEKKGGTEKKDGNEKTLKKAAPLKMASTQRAEAYIMKRYRQKGDDFYDEVDEEMRAQQYAWEDRDWVWRTKLPPAHRKFVEQSVLAVVRDVDPAQFRVDRIMSRCPSGYDLVVFKEDGQLSNEGELLVEEGCHERSMGTFRYDLASGEVHVKITDEIGYLSLEEYVPLYAEAIAGFD